MSLSRLYFTLVGSIWFHRAKHWKINFFLFVLHSYNSFTEEITAFSFKLYRFNIFDLFWLNALVITLLRVLGLNTPKHTKVYWLSSLTATWNWHFIKKVIKFPLRLPFGHLWYFIVLPLHWLQWVSHIELRLCFTLFGFKHWPIDLAFTLTRVTT